MNKLVNLKTNQRQGEENIELRDRAVSEIRKAIVSRQFLPGERLVASKIATQLKMSRTPVREALQALEASGYLSRLQSSSGYFVKKFTADEIREYYEIREALECKALELVCQNITNEQLKKAQRFHEEMIQSAKQGHYDQWPAMNAVFHSDYLYSTCGNNRLCSLIRSFRDQFLENTFIAAVLEYEWEVRSEEHTEILEALRKRDVSLVQRALHNHLMTGLKSSLRIIK